MGMAGSREAGPRTLPSGDEATIGSSKSQSRTSRNQHAERLSHESDGPMNFPRSTGLERCGRFAGGKTWVVQLDK